MNPRVAVRPPDPVAELIDYAEQATRRRRRARGPKAAGALGGALSALVASEVAARETDTAVAAADDFRTIASADELSAFAQWCETREDAPGGGHARHERFASKLAGDADFAARLGARYGAHDDHDPLTDQVAHGGAHAGPQAPVSGRLATRAAHAHEAGESPIGAMSSAHGAHSVEANAREEIALASAVAEDPHAGSAHTAYDEVTAVPTAEAAPGAAILEALAALDADLAAAPAPAAQSSAHGTDHAIDLAAMIAGPIILEAPVPVVDM